MVISAADIRAFRGRHKLSQERFAMLMGVSRMTVYIWEKYGILDRDDAAAKFRKLEGKHGKPDDKPVDVGAA